MLGHTMFRKQSRGVAAVCLAVALVAALSAQPALARSGKPGGGTTSAKTSTSQTTGTTGTTATTGTTGTTAVVTESTTATTGTTGTTAVVTESTTATTGSTGTSGDSTGESAVTPYDPVATLGSLYNLVDQIGARSLWQQGITGRGVDVAVIDTGVVPVPALSDPDKVVAVVDLSLEASVPEATYLDNYGHGTHMAGIIAGRDPGADPRSASERPTEFVGVAPDAGIVSVKVGDNTGAVDVSQVIAGIDWVIQHRNADGLNIRVLNLSYGTDGSQDYRIDPLAAAVERAWEAGIVVVVAAGNEGWHSRGLANPAYDPFVITVGGAEPTASGFKVPSWTSSGELATQSKDGSYALWFSDDYAGRPPTWSLPGERAQPARTRQPDRRRASRGVRQRGALQGQRDIAGRRRGLRCSGAAPGTAAGADA
ncbi:MAG: S8 family serine peptidase [Acidimicrobiales bacterium]